MEVVYERCAGIDIHKKMVQVCCITLKIFHSQENYQQGARYERVSPSCLASRPATDGGT